MNEYGWMNMGGSRHGIPPRLRKEGFRFIRTKGKIPIGKDWNKEGGANYAYNDQVLEDHLQGGGNYGVLCGEGLIVIDCDKPEIADLVEEHLPRTFTVKTGRGGKHYYYYCDDIKGNIRLTSGNGTQGDIGDIQAKGKQVIGPGSTHPNGNKYEIVDGQDIATIKVLDIERTLTQYIDKKDVERAREEEREIIKEHGRDIDISITDLISITGFTKIGEEYQGSHPVHGSTGGRNLSINPAKNLWRCFRHDTGGGPLSLLGVLEGVISCHQAVPGALSGDRFWKVCDIGREKYGLDLPKKTTKAKAKDKEEESKIKTSMVEDGGIFAEQIMADEGPAFVYLDDGGPVVRKELEIGGMKYSPRYDEALKMGAVILPDGAEDYGSTSALLEEIRALIHEYVDVSDEYERLTAWYIITTWVYDRLPSLSYLRALGDTGTGKSRFLKIVGSLCYKPIKVSGAVTPAPIYRILEQWKGTLILDEGDLSDSKATADIIKILNSGFEKGTPVMRCKQDDADTIQFFDCYGPKIISTRHPFDDKALESRCLTEVLEETRRMDIPDTLPLGLTDSERFRSIRRRLLMWRLKNRHRVDIDRAQGVDLGIVEPRLKQVSRGFLAVFDDPMVEAQLKSFLGEHQAQLIEQRANTLEGMVINSIYRIYSTHITGGNEGDPKIWSGKIAERIKDDYGEPATPQIVGLRFKELGLHTSLSYVKVEEYDKEEGIFKTKEKRLRTISWEDKRLKRLFDRYIPLNERDGIIWNKLFEENNTKNNLSGYLGEQVEQVEQVYRGTPRSVKKEGKKENIGKLERPREGTLNTCSTCSTCSGDEKKPYMIIRILEDLPERDLKKQDVLTTPHNVGKELIDQNKAILVDTDVSTVTEAIDLKNCIVSALKGGPKPIKELYEIGNGYGITQIGDMISKMKERGKLFRNSEGAIELS